MTVRIVTPYSQLFADPGVKRKILALSDMVELRDMSQVESIVCPALWHCELSLVEPWNTGDRAEVKAMIDGLVRAGAQFPALSFHVLSRYRINDIVDGAFVGRGEPMREDEMFANADDNMSVVRMTLAGTPFSAAEILMENNNHLGTDAYDTVTDPDFLGLLMERTGTGLLLDVAHARITALNRGVSEAAYLNALPISRCVQVHLSRPGMRGALAYDAHEALTEQDWTYFTELAPSLSHLRYATVEYYKDANVLAEQIARLRVVLDGLETKK